MKFGNDRSANGLAKCVATSQRKAVKNGLRANFEGCGGAYVGVFNGPLFQNFILLRSGFEVKDSEIWEERKFVELIEVKFCAHTTES